MTVEALAALLREHPAASGASLAVLHGSRARGDGALDADWDIGVLADDDTDPAALVAALTGVLRTDAVDVVDLRRASALLRFRAARDGVALLERPPGEFLRFRLDAVHYWCDVGPVIRAAHDDVLAALR
ncbi:MAG: nucleotidyltransferase domain-containing protein [Pseudonocardia sp.]|nr:nucleotidyltransferase domain-containing protein [Pseudonocardia sp.]